MQWKDMAWVERNGLGLTHHPIKNILITLSCIYIIFWGWYNQTVFLWFWHPNKPVGKKKTAPPFTKLFLCKSLLINKLLKTQKHFSFWMHWVLFVALGAFTSQEEKGYSLVGMPGCLPLRWLLLSQSVSLEFVAHGLGAPWHVGLSQTRDRTHIPCIGKQILSTLNTPGSLYLLF